MPTLTQRACRHPGCRRTEPHSHRPPDARESATKRGYGVQHKNWRKLILARDPICRACKREPATEADHVVPLARSGDWSLENGQGLCKACHSRKTLSEQVGGTAIVGRPQVDEAITLADLCF